MLSGVCSADEDQAVTFRAPGRRMGQGVLRALGARVSAGPRGEGVLDFGPRGGFLSRTPVVPRDLSNHPPCSFLLLKTARACGHPS